MTPLLFTPPEQIAQLSTEFLQQCFRHLRAAHADYDALIDSYSEPFLPPERQPEHIRIWKGNFLETADLLHALAAALLARKKVPGICCLCGCAEHTPCVISDKLRCAWCDETETCCDHEICEDLYSLFDVEVSA